VMFTSDHGEMLGDHNHVQKRSFYHGSLTVPTAIRHPAFKGGVTCRAPVEITDLTATILDCAGVDPADALSKKWPAFHDRVPCRSLLPIVDGSRDSVREFAFSECDGLWQAAVGARRKYVRWLSGDDAMSREALFDLAADPNEERDLISSAGGCLTGSPEGDKVLEGFRIHVQRIMDTTPAAQLRWAPLPEEGEAFSYPEG